MPAAQEPGPRCRALLAQLRAHEPPGLTAIHPRRTIVWESARGAHVHDADGRRYLDLGGAFGVALIGHAHPRVIETIERHAGRLLHAMADVHPSRTKVELLAELAAVAPGDLDAGYLGLGGADAVEAALKTAALVTGRPGVVAFRGAYHGLSYGALRVCGHDALRAPFAAQLGAVARFLPFPTGAAFDPDSPAATALERRIADPAVGAVIVEPIQGRGGLHPGAPGFLPALRALCTRHGVLLIADEIWSGLGRTGRWFAVEAEAVVPDLLLIGKALGGGLPISAALGNRRRMGCWATAGGVALHTATFAGHALAAAVARTVLAVIREEGLVERAARLGQRARAALAGGLAGVAGVHSVRGTGLMLGIELRRPDGGEPDGARVGAVLEQALARGLLLLAGGEGGEVLELTPPLTIEEDEFERGLAELVALLRRVPPGGGVQP